MSFAGWFSWGSQLSEDVMEGDYQMVATQINLQVIHGDTDDEQTLANQLRL